MGKSAMPGVPGRFGTPHTLWLGAGATNCRARTMATQEAPGGSNPPQLGWAFRRYFDRSGPIYFWSAAGLFLGDRYQ